MSAILETVKTFLTNPVSDAVSLPGWSVVAAGVAVILAVIIIISAVVNGKKSAKNKEESEPVKEANAESEACVAEEAAPSVVAEETSVKEEVAESPVEEEAEESPAEQEDTVREVTVRERVAAAKKLAEGKYIPAKEEDKAKEPAKKTEQAKEPVKQPVKKAAPAKAPVQKAEPVKEPVKKAEPVQKAEPVKEPVKKAEPVQKAEPVKEPVKKAEPVQKAEPVEEPVKKAEPAKKPAAKKAPAKSAPKEEVAAEVDSDNKVVGKYELVTTISGGFRYLLIANNGQLLYRSTEYKSLDSCRKAIAGFVNSVEKSPFRVSGDKFGNYKFTLQSATSNLIVYVGESYKDKDRCVRGVESVKRFASISPIVDRTDDDEYKSHTVIFEIPKDVKDAVKKGDGATGRWEISAVEPDNAATPYVYSLYANNGQLLYEGREYRSLDSCKKGLVTFIENIKTGTFVVDKDKFGHYKFILSKVGSQMEYVGQAYDDKTSCTDNAVSVYKFGLLTPIE